MIYKYNKRKFENQIDFGDVLEEYNEIIEELELSMNDEDEFQTAMPLSTPYDNMMGGIPTSPGGDGGGRNRADTVFFNAS